MSEIQEYHDGLHEAFEHDKASASAWISVEDRKPERLSPYELSAEVLTHGSDGFHIAEYFDADDGWYDPGEGRHIWNVRYWMPLPPAPGSVAKLTPDPPEGCSCQYVLYGADDEERVLDPECPEHGKSAGNLPPAPPVV